MKVFSCVFVIIGVIIGAGFASGKEIYTFFFVYGKYGIFGAFISILIIGFAIYKILKIIKRYNVNSYDEFLDIVSCEHNAKHVDIKIILNFIINIFLLITFFVMCAGFSAYFKQEFEINPILSCAIFCLFCFIVLNKSIKGVVLLNGILIPVITVILLILGVKAFDTNFEITEIYNSNIWIAKAIFYASYNSITLVSILIPMKGYIKREKDIFNISIICMIIIGVLSGVIFILLLSLDEDINKIELPTVYVANSFGVIYKYLYGGIILGAITTTAISSAYGFLNNISNNKNKYKRNNFIICILAVFVSMFGFSNLVNSIYPVFGLLGLIQLVMISLYRIRK